MLKLMAAGAAGAALASWAAREALAQVQRPGKLAALAGAQVRRARRGDHGKGHRLQGRHAPTTTSTSSAPTRPTRRKNAHTLKTTPWTVEVEGLVKKPASTRIEDLLKLSAQEERIYRLRCVEGWSMVIPWVGYSLAELIKKVEPLGNAKYVEFVTLADPKTMPFVGSRVLDWPYVEGLRMDEAMHPLTLLTFGMYGEVLPNQNGAPVRAGGAVEVRLQERQVHRQDPLHRARSRKTAWNKAAANEYGFYSNVNPNVDHPRWSQATERRIGEDGLFAKKRKTLMFNGYEAQVGQLYAGMDLKKNF